MRYSERYIGHQQAPKTALGAILAEIHEKSSGDSASSQHGSNVTNDEIIRAYHANAKKSNDPSLQFEFCNFLLEYSDTITDPVTRNKYFQEGMEWLRKLAYGNAKSEAELWVQSEAQYRLAEFLSQGINGVADRTQAWNLFESSAKKGNILAAYRAGICCEDGIGRKANFSRALLYYRKAASQNHFGAIFKLITIYVYRSQEFQVARSAYEGFKWLKIAASHTMNNPEERDIYALAALYELGIWYADGHPDSAPIPDFTLDAEYAIELIYESGRRGYAPAQFKLGEIFEQGTYKVRVDLPSAVFWYRKVLENTKSGENSFVRLQEWQAAAMQRLRSLESGQKLGFMRSDKNRYSNGNATQDKRRSQMKSLTKDLSHLKLSPHPDISPRRTVLPPDWHKRKSHTELSESGKRALHILSARKKLKREKAPDHIQTKFIKKRRSEQVAQKVSKAAAAQSRRY